MKIFIFSKKAISCKSKFLLLSFIPFISVMKQTTFMDLRKRKIALTNNRLAFAYKGVWKKSTASEGISQTVLIKKISLTIFAFTEKSKCEGNCIGWKLFSRK